MNNEGENGMYENSLEEIRMAQNGDKNLMANLIEKNNGLIWSIVKRFSGRGYEIEDLYQIGAMGFIKAIKRFDTSFEVKLSTYAVPYILGEIKRFVRDDGPIKVSRSLKELNIRRKELQKRYWETEGREMTIQQIADELKVSKEEIALAMETDRPVDSIYAEMSGGEDEEGNTLFNRISNKEDEAEIISNKIAIQELIRTLNAQEKEIILLRYYKEKTQTQVAKILGISQVQVSRIEKRILQSMKVKLTC